MASSGFLGIGTSTPASHLDVLGSATIRGNVAASNLTVSQDVFASRDVYASNVLLTGDVECGKNLFVVNGTSTFKGAANAGAFVTSHMPNSDGKNYIRGDTVLVDTGGNVGVGTTSPSFKLDVAGTTNTQKFRMGNNTFNLFSVASFEVGSSGSKTKNLEVSGSFPTNYHVFATPRNATTNLTDCFGVTTVERTSSLFRLAVSRINGDSWAQNLSVDVIIVGFD
jgi:hypothetical protein